jgi:hypothetical protein
MTPKINHSQNTYRIWAEKQNDLLIFSQPWWLDCVCGNKEHWDVVILESQGKIVFAFPYLVKRIFGFPIMHITPPISPYTGPWIHDLAQPKYVDRHAAYWKLLRQFSNQLPKSGISIFNLSLEHNEMLPFIWKGWHCSIRYTFIMDQLQKSTENELWEELGSTTKNHIRHAEKTLQISHNPSADEVVALVSSSFIRKNSSIPFRKERLFNLVTQGFDKNYMIGWVAKTGNDEPVATLVLVVQHHRAWILLQGTKGGKKARGASAFLQWNAIKYCREKAYTLDFEGSMIEQIATNNLSFGAKAVPYFQIKSNSILTKVWSIIRK